jgi:hypothetical protein
LLLQYFHLLFFQNVHFTFFGPSAGAVNFIVFVLVVKVEQPVLVRLVLLQLLYLLQVSHFFGCGIVAEVSHTIIDYPNLRVINVSVVYRFVHIPQEYMCIFAFANEPFLCQIYDAAAINEP